MESFHISYIIIILIFWIMIIKTVYNTLTQKCLGAIYLDFLSMSFKSHSLKYLIYIGEFLKSMHVNKQLRLNKFYVHKGKIRYLFTKTNLYIMKWWKENEKKMCCKISSILVSSINLSHFYVFHKQKKIHFWFLQWTIYCQIFSLLSKVISKVHDYSTQ